MMTELSKIDLLLISRKSSKNLKKDLDQFESACLPKEERVLLAERLLQESIKLRDRPFELLRREAALEYREGLAVQTSLSLNDPLFFGLMQTAKKWKSAHPLLKEKLLTADEEQRLIRTAAYPKFVELLLKSSSFQDKFFKWMIRDGLEPEVFVEFPHLYERLIHAHLNGRLSRVGGHLLKIRSGEMGKFVTLPFEGKEINILDESAKVVFKGEYALTVREIFRVFELKDKQIGNLEFLADGVVNWNDHQLGSWNALEKRFDRVDISKNGWWKQLPAFEVLGLTQAQERYGAHLDGTMWNVAATASRGSATLDFDKSHAYLEVAIPQEGGRYAIYAFGKFATKLPQNFFDKLTFLCQNLHATVAFPDENVYYTHRQHAQKNFALTPEQGFRLMEAVAADIELARQSNFVYQIESDNCAKWSHEIIVSAIGSHHVPNLFQMPLLETEPVGPAKYIFGSIKQLPASLHVPVLNLIHFVLGAWKKTRIIENGNIVDKSLCRHAFWKSGVVYLPAHLHYFMANQSEWRPASAKRSSNEADTQGTSQGNIWAPGTQIAR